MDEKTCKTDQLHAALTQRCASRPDGKSALRCEDAFELARAFKVTIAEVGDLCNAQGIKIVHCQLGCFQ